MLLFVRQSLVSKIQQYLATSTSSIMSSTKKPIEKPPVLGKLVGPDKTAKASARPKSTASGHNTRSSTQARKLAPSSSAGNVNVKRNVRQRRNQGNNKADHAETSVTKAFEKLSIKDNAKLSVQSRRHISSASNGSHICKSLEDVARWILNKKCNNVIVMAGAGISTSSGIPDFRSPGSGLYDNLQQYNIPFPEAIFDIEFFQRDPRPFFTLAKELYPGTYRPNYVHYFVRMLHEKGILLRMYTQNIDGLERMSGIPAAKIVEAHGTFATSTCSRCGHKYDGSDTKEDIMNDKTPHCKQRNCKGIVKPDIVFFGEDLPKRFFFYLKDFPQCDLVLVMGTSLEVQPFAGIIDSARSYIPRLLINREVVGPFSRPRTARFNDSAVTGDLVDCVRRFGRTLGWKKDLDVLISAHERTLDKEYGARKADPDSRLVDGTKPTMAPTNGKASTIAPANRSGSRGYKANSCQSMDALKRRDAANPSIATGSPTRNYHSETTSKLNLHVKPTARRAKLPCVNSVHRSTRSDTSDSSDSSSTASSSGSDSSSC